METHLLSSHLQEAARANGITFSPANDSGILPTINYIRNTYPDLLTPLTILSLGAELPNICGAYPQDTPTERGLSKFYIAAFFSLLLGSLAIFAIGYKRGHFFWPLHLMSAYCLLSGIGFICRLKWAQDLSDIRLGVASIVLCQFAEYLLVLASLVFAHRLCAWRSPRKAWQGDIFTLFYLLGGVSYICSSVGQITPYYNFLTPASLQSCRALLMAGSCLELIFAIVPFPLVYAAAILGWNTRTLGGASECRYPIYQPSWIENAHLFSYPIPIHRPIDRQKHPEVATAIPTYELPADGKNRMLSKPMLPESPQVFPAHLIVFISSLLLSTAPIMRILSNTLTNSETSQYILSTNPLEMGHTYFPQSPPALWAFFGGVQMAVLVAWMLLRVDLRFYLPPVFWRENGERSERQKIYEALA